MTIELRDYQNKLVNDARSAIQRGRKAVCCVLGCGGGKSIIQGTIAQLTTKRKNRVLFLVHRKELCQQIEGTFKLCGVDFKLCSVMMVQTACRRLHKMPRPDLIIVDEAHHILSASYIKILEYYKGVPMLGFTATPSRMNEGGLGAVFEELILSVSTEWLIENHYLAPYRYYSVQLADASKLHTKCGDYDRAELEELMNKSAIFGGAVENWLKLANGKKTIVYCSSIETSKNTVKAFQDAGIAAAHLDGTTPKAERESVVNDFRTGKIKVLSNVDLFGEGFDVPDCEAVVLLRPTKSLTLHIQQSMRSMRYDPKNPEKVAIILDHVGNYTRHGLPDDEREWSLEAKTKKSKKKDEKPIKQCPVCFSVVDSSAKICPYCMHVFKPEPRAERKTIEGYTLEEITKMPYADYIKFETWEGLEEFRKLKKYKMGWSFRRAAELGIAIPRKYWYQINHYYSDVKGARFG